MRYFVVMQDYGKRGREAVVDPEITRREVVSRIISGEYKNICFIHEVADGIASDVTDEILDDVHAEEANQELRFWTELDQIRGAA